MADAVTWFGLPQPDRDRARISQMSVDLVVPDLVRLS
jgi:hypothetical protein